MTPALEVLIAGGGIAGLACALALARVGVASVVVERRAALSEAGAGIQIGPNGVRVLAAIGALDRLLPQAGRPGRIVAREGSSGRVLQSLPLGDWIERRHGAPYLVAHRRDLQAALFDAVAAEPLVRFLPGFAVTSLAQRDGRVLLTAEDGRRLEGDALIGADGLHSAIRTMVTVPCAQPRFSGRTAARTVIAAERFGRHLDGSATGVWLSPGAHVVHYPVSAGREVAVVVVRDEEWREQEWNAEVSREAVLATLSPYADALRAALAEAEEWRRWALYVAPPLKRWSVGSVTLAGDAAHPLLPFLAQGGCLALEDAVVLAAAIAACPHDLPAALKAYADARQPRAAAIQAASRRNGRIFHLDGMAARARDLGLGLLPPAHVMAGYDWVYGWRPPALTRR